MLWRGALLTLLTGCGLPAVFDVLFSQGGSCHARVVPLWLATALCMLCIFWQAVSMAAGTQRLLECSGQSTSGNPPQSHISARALALNHVSLMLLWPLPATGHVPRVQGSTGGQGAAAPAPRLPPARPALQVVLQPAGTAWGGGGGRAQGRGLPTPPAALALGGRCAEPAQRWWRRRSGLSCTARITPWHGRNGRSRQWDGGRDVTQARVGRAWGGAAAAGAVCFRAKSGTPGTAPAHRRGGPAASPGGHSRVGGWARW